MNPLKSYTLSQLPENCRKVLGRTTKELSPLTLFWTGSGVELNITGSELWLELNTGYDRLEVWAAVVINGALLSRIMLPKGRSKLCLFRGMNAEAVKNIRFIRESQAMPEDPGVFLQIDGLSTDGDFLPVPPRAKNLEFIGDSITSGEGLAGAKPEMDWIPMFFSAVYGFPMGVGELLDADVQVISQSGWGVVSDWTNNPYHALPKYYDQICGPLTGEQNLSLGAGEPWDFSAHRPVDAVVVNLGTNDSGALNQPAWQDPATGEAFQQKMAPDGSMEPSDAERFQQAVGSFLKLLRRRNPEALLVWAFGMIDCPTVEPLLRRGIEEYRQETGDLRAHYLALPQVREETMGSRGHPGRENHREAAETIAAFLRENL